MVVRICLLLVALLLSACSTIVEQPCPPPPHRDVVYVIGAGWHTEIGLPVTELDKNMASFTRTAFPGARYILFGYGKRTFVTAPVRSLSEYVVGPFPGPAVMHIVGLNVKPDTAYTPDHVLVLKLPPGGKQNLSKALWQDMAKDEDGKPVYVAPSKDPAGSFYDSVSEYNLGHTCNTWTADMLHAAGLDMSGDNVMFSGAVMSQAQDVADQQCR